MAQIVAPRQIMWAVHVGMRWHPEWYPGLTSNSPLIDFQLFIHNNFPGKCPIPCGVPMPQKWCHWPPAGNLTAPSVYDSEPNAIDAIDAFGNDSNDSIVSNVSNVSNADMNNITIKVLTYNLFWWNLYRVRQGDGESAGKLMKAEIEEDRPFDVIGFQECEDGHRALEPVGLLHIYNVLQGPHAVCLAYRKDVWNLLTHGMEDVGEDMRSHYYGRRGVFWMRLEHYDTGRKLLFVNHHGPLEVNSGGECGGDSIANNIIHVIQNKSRPGDAIILVGDFNANAASRTVQALWKRMVMLHSGTSFGGVDNIFGNMDSSSVISRKNLGPGGSDHDALTATVTLGVEAARVEVAVEAIDFLKAQPPGNEWQHFWCGQLETDVGYVPAEGSFLRVVKHKPHRGDSLDVAAPQRCCRLCQQDPRCRSWIWKDGGPSCEMYGAAPVEMEKVPGFVSGLSAAEATLQGGELALRALTSLRPT
ncbi:unnamed protein product [Effrenium voratum]|nr:unnamed protein product [Effrenium voratum]